MGIVRQPDKVKLIVGLLSNRPDMFSKTKKVLEKMFGKVDHETALIDFTHTDYYNKEFGAGLKRKFVSFERPFSLAGLYRVKLATNRLEKSLSVSGKRTINIDPGYLDLSKLVLFSTKDFSHRIHVDRGVFAEVTLFYKDKSFNAWPWTYPDYKTGSYIDTFNRIREIYREKFLGTSCL